MGRLQRCHCEAAFAVQVCYGTTSLYSVPGTCIRRKAPNTKGSAPPVCPPIAEPTPCIQRGALNTEGVLDQVNITISSQHTGGKPLKKPLRGFLPLFLVGWGKGAAPPLASTPAWQSSSQPLLPSTLKKPSFFCQRRTKKTVTEKKRCPPS